MPVIRLLITITSDDDNDAGMAAHDCEQWLIAVSDEDDATIEWEWL